MFKTIGLSLFYTVLFLGLYGCSCSESPKESNRGAGLYIANLAVLEDDGGTTDFEVAVALERDNQDTVTVNYEVKELTNTDAIGGTSGSTAGADFVTKNGTLTFEPNGSTTQTISFSIINDTLYEHDEEFIVELTSATNAQIVDAESIVTITDNDPAPIASIEIITALADTTFAENEVGTVELKVSLDTVSGVDAIFSILEARETTVDPNSVGATAAYRVDYLLKTLDDELVTIERLTIPEGETEMFINMSIIDDGMEENDESFTLKLIEEVDVNINGSSSELAFTLTDNDQADATTQLVIPLNDSGITELTSASITTNDVECTTTEQCIAEMEILQDALDNEMDARMGRDAATLTKVGDGRTGFDFTRLDSSGNEVSITLAQDQTVADIDLTWDCVRDNNTGLVWEVKVRGNVGLRAADRDFYWYDPNFDTNGGVAGNKGDFECDKDDLSTCNTSYYVADINAQQLCGLTGWRVPTITELRSIIDYNTGGSADSAAYDTDYFAGDTLGVSYYWSSTTYAVDTNKAWAVQFRSGVTEEFRDKSTEAVGSTVRLVNDSLIKQAQQP